MTRQPKPVVIVMIEDDDGHARLIDINIRRAGVTNEIQSFRDGSSALKFLRSPAVRANQDQSYLILLDLNLPDMTGIDILAKLKADETLRRSPIIVLTTTDDQREIQRCYDLGANVYITKPLNYDSFAHAIRQLGLFLSVMQIPEAN
ncbi:MAG: response regulator [Ancalomicrobiaceae bacterium]|nr:response regulator [Ancalomicrobiaceae bacterium]